jgi:hypothetical protein
MGGDRRSGRIEVHRDYLLGLNRRQPDLMLLEIEERLVANCGERFSSAVIWRFFDGPINAASFEEWVEKCLALTVSKGDIVVMDNLSSHKDPRYSNSSRRPEPSCHICRPKDPT